ncbi:pentapeptide repeat-containing protein [Streptomyces sp. AC536]|uniref:pentapeptide repeat-containing protein n=1 Tax=Streptomyces buecherae TaxID=2763006 RepID=UPI00164E7687|nr:pentapeptide repeat-containing protein [Streptomyces buecherae]MBC3984475.1 pentapeptide repeat-containing protein [Streptomyces buecherae]QNJ38716.1 pentapeptide repeat-containing protein [Streptomyces buecherae]
MRSRWRRRWRPTWGSAAVAGAVLVGVLLALVYSPTGRWLVRWTCGPEWSRMDGAARSAALGQFRLAAVQSMGVLGAGAALVFTGFTYRLSRRGQVTDRLTKAVERLGATEVHVRLGGVLALERFVRDSPAEAAHAASILNAFLRERAPRVRSPEVGAAALRATLGRRPPRALAAQRPHAAPEADVQAALTALTHPASRRHVPPDTVIDLSHLDLAYADLPHADLRGARLVHTDLTGVRAPGADLNGAWLAHAKLAEAELDGARLDYAQLDHADLSDARLDRAHLAHAWLTRADLSGARLNDADLSRTQLVATDLTGAELNAADLTGAYLHGARLTGARLWDANLTGAQVNGDLAHAMLGGATLTDAVLSHVDLRNTLVGTEQIVAARPLDVRLSPELAADPRVAARLATVATWTYSFVCRRVTVDWHPGRPPGGAGDAGASRLAFERNALGVALSPRPGG